MKKNTATKSMTATPKASAAQMSSLFIAVCCLLLRSSLWKESAMNKNNALHPVRNLQQSKIADVRKPQKDCCISNGARETYF